MKSGIYAITNKVTGCRYVGSSIHIESRINEHLKMLTKGTHHNTSLQEDWTLFGVASFVTSVLELVEDPSELLSREQFYLDHTISGYNSLHVATKPPSGLAFKQKMQDVMNSPEIRTKLILGISNRRKQDPSYIERMTATINTPEVRNRKATATRKSWDRRREKYGPSGCSNPELKNSQTSAGLKRSWAERRLS